MSASSGASLMGLTVMMEVCGALVSTPPLKVPPSSFRMMVRVAAPFAFSAGVYVNVPVAEMAGAAANKAGLLLLIIKVSACADSFAGPGLMLLAQFGTI